MRVFRPANVACTSTLLLVILISLVLLLALSLLVVLNIALPGDALLLQAAMSLRTPLLTAFLSVPAFLASAAPALCLCVALSFVEWRRVRHTPVKSLATTLRIVSWPTCAFVIAFIINVIMRTAIGRMPPQVDYLPQYLPEFQAFFQKYSFPSGHASSALVAYGSLALVAHKYPRFRWIGYVVAFLVIATIAFDRPYLGVHWPSDVIAGFLLGMLSVSLSLYLCRRSFDSSIA